jgi:hypothetical protein
MGKSFMRILLSFLLILSFGAGLALGDSVINPRYHTYEEIVAFADSIQNISAYNAILDVREIGRSNNEDLPIYAFKFSDNPTLDEDEPALLFTGQCHAEEILGVEITMGLIDSLLHGFDNFNSHIGAILQNLEVWIVPTYNPEGLRVVHDGLDVTYRKNKTDNNGNGSFDFVEGIGFDIDGVDFNRNYDFNWIFGDAYEVGDYDYYRGPAPFSESETRAIADLAKQEKFLLSVAYHSARSGTPEIIYYSWEWEATKNPPDIEIMRSLAETLSQRVINESGDGNYAVTPGKTPRGNAHDWFYTQTGAIQFLVEVGTNNLQPNTNIVNGTVARNLEGLFFLMDRAFGRTPESKSMIRGIVRDASDSFPLEGAQIKIGKRKADGSIKPLEGLMMKPRVTDGFGRYRRLLTQGTYQVIASAPGFRPDTMASILTSDNYASILDFSLEPAPIHTIEMELSQASGSGQYQVMMWDAYQRDTLQLAAGTHDFEWQGDEISLQISAPGCFPELHHFDLRPYTEGMTLSFSVDLPSEPTLVYETDFQHLDAWQINAGEWFVENGVLISQPDLFYGIGLTAEMSMELDLSSTPDAQRLGVQLNHSYEVEWHVDTLALEIWDTQSSELILRKTWFDQRFTPHTETLLTQGDLPEAAQLKLLFHSDSTVGFRGWRIDSLSVFVVDDPVVGIDLNQKQGAGQAIRQGLAPMTAMTAPNPFQIQTRLDIQVPTADLLHIQVFDVRGREVFNTRQTVQAGSNSWVWHGQDMIGHRLSTGLYFVKLTSSSASISKKLLMIDP